MNHASLATCVVVSLVWQMAAVQAGQPPGEILDLSRWRLTLPVNTAIQGDPDEISMPNLRTYSHSEYFFAGHNGNRVVFRAHCGGQTTRGSRYPRCELREMKADGTTDAAWSTADSRTHTMTARMAITATPSVKKHVVCAQIHDADDDLLMIRLEGKKLFIERNSSGDVMLTRNYQMGTPFSIRVQASGGKARVWYNDTLYLTWTVDRDGCYFKAGCYTQSNVDMGDDSSAFGEVIIYGLRISHESRPEK